MHIRHLAVHIFMVHVIEAVVRHAWYRLLLILDHLIVCYLPIWLHLLNTRILHVTVLIHIVNYLFPVQIDGSLRIDHALNLIYLRIFIVGLYMPHHVFLITHRAYITFTDTHITRGHFYLLHLFHLHLLDGLLFKCLGILSLTFEAEHDKRVK